MNVFFSLLCIYASRYKLQIATKICNHHIFIIMIQRSNYLHSIQDKTLSYIIFGGVFSLKKKRRLDLTNNFISWLKCWRPFYEKKWSELINTLNYLIILFTHLSPHFGNRSSRERKLVFYMSWSEKSQNSYDTSRNAWHSPMDTLVDIICDSLMEFCLPNFFLFIDCFVYLIFLFFEFHVTIFFLLSLNWQ